MLRRSIVSPRSPSWPSPSVVAAPALAQDAADAIVRLSRLESQVRQLSGQIEQLQFENRQLKEQLRKFQEDVEFRFQEGRGGSRPPAPAASPVAAAASPAQPPEARSDAFDPAAGPEAPGAPRPLGIRRGLRSPRRSRPAGASHGAARRRRSAGIGDLIEEDDAPAGSAPLDLQGTGRAGTAPPRRGRARASRPPAPAIRGRTTRPPTAISPQKQYEQAEMGFRRFLQSQSPRQAGPGGDPTGSARAIFSAAATGRRPSSS